jgi:hypothetical protein
MGALAAATDTTSAKRSSAPARSTKAERTERSADASARSQALVSVELHGEVLGQLQESSDASRRGGHIRHRRVREIGLAAYRRDTAS